MNLVLSGPIDASLLNLAVARAKPRQVIRLHERAQRLVGALDDTATRADIEALCSQARVDHAFVEEGLRFSDFKLLAMDMDSTLITIECIDEIADFAGKKAEVAAITAAAMRGEIPDFAESLRRRVALLAGVDAKFLDDVYKYRLKLSEGTTRLLAETTRCQIRTCLVSGGFTYFTNKLKTLLNLNEAHGNTLEIRHGKITGCLLDPVIDAYGKHAIVLDAAERLKCSRKNILVIGDGANDIPMMRAAAYSIAYRAKAPTIKEASHNVKYGNLSTIIDYFADATVSEVA